MFADASDFLFPGKGHVVSKEKGGEGSLKWTGKPDHLESVLQVKHMAKAHKSSCQLRDKVKFYEGMSVHWGAPSNTFNLVLEGLFLTRASLS